MTSDEILRRGHIGRWRVVRLIGEGGFSWVFEVMDEKSGKHLALKVLQPKAAAGEEYRRFLKEAKILAAQNDPHLVAIVLFDRDEELGVDYIVMELLTGRTLAQLLKAEGEQPTKRVVSIFLGALQGLARLHAVRPPVIHRDIKPPNIQITDDGVAKILDLGIAGTQRGREDETVAAADDTYTTTALFKGTPKYASPEQLQVLDLDTSSDVFSMGLCLFEALEGHHPYADQPDIPTVTYQSVLGFYARLEGGRKQISLEFRRTPKPIQSVVRKALSLRPADRYRTAGEMHRALAGAAQGQDAASSPDSTGTQTRLRPAPPRQPARSAQRWVPLAAAAAAVALLAVGIGIYVAGKTTTTAPEPVGATEKTTPEVEEEARPSGPTAAQTTRRGEASRVVAEVERLRSEGSADAEDAERVIQRQRDGEAQWAAGSLEDAGQTYGAVISEGNGVIAIARTGTLAKSKQALEQAREQARQENAEFNAPTEWVGAEGVREQAQRAESESRSADAARQYASAREAYEGASAQAEKALAAAQNGETSARNARARLPGKGDCRAFDEPKAKRACEEGARALEDGSDALAAKNAPSAVGSFQLASRQFENSRKLVPPPSSIVVSTTTTLSSNVPTSTTLPIKQTTASDPTAEVRATLDEYADAVSSCNLETLGSIYPKAVPFFKTCSTGESNFAASVTSVGVPEFLKGDRARQRISQSIHKVTKEGKRIPIFDGPFVATLSHRADGWYIESMVKN